MPIQRLTGPIPTPTLNDRTTGLELISRWRRVVIRRDSEWAKRAISAPKVSGTTLAKPSLLSHLALRHRTHESWMDVPGSMLAMGLIRMLDLAWKLGLEYRD